MNVAFAIFTIFMALELPLLVIHKLFPQSGGVLPLGGDEFSQVAILLMTALFTAQLFLFGRYCFQAFGKWRADADKVRRASPTGTTPAPAKGAVAAVEPSA